MDQSILARIAVRRQQVALVLAPVVILMSFAGCSHRRNAMRPVYGTPVVGGATIVTPTTPSGPILTQPQTDEPMLTPIPSGSGSSSNANSGVNRTSITPPVPAEAEPPLNDLKPIDLGPPASPTPSTNPSSGVNLNKPTAYQGTGRSASVPVSNSRAILRETVAQFVVEPNDLFQPPKADRPWKFVVIHHSANAKGGLDQVDRDHRKVLGFEGCGYHFVIGNGTDSPDGQIEIADRWLNQKHGVHCRNGKTADVNEYGVGICLVGNFDQTEPTPKQVAAARALVAYLGDRYKIPTDHIGSHDEFADGPTACPGKNFPSVAIFGSKHMAAR